MKKDMVKIDPSQIPNVEMNNLAVTFLSAIKKFYDDPANMVAFQEWKRQREAKQLLIP